MNGISLKKILIAFLFIFILSKTKYIFAWFQDNSYKITDSFDVFDAFSRDARAAIAYAILILIIVLFFEHIGRK